MKRIEDFSQERICSLGNWVRENLSLRVFVRRGIEERFLNKKKNHDRYRKDDSNDENVDTVTGMLVDVVLVTSCADREIALMYTFVVKSVCHIMRHTLQETSKLTTSIFHQTILLRRMTFIFLDSSWKRIHAWVRKIERISPISSISTSLSYFFEFDRKESRLDETSGRRRFVV